MNKVLKERIDNIKGLINRDILEESINKNKDSYGGACVEVAINIMTYLDEFEGEFNIGYSPDMTTPHGIICKCDDQGGITGFMAGAARNIVANCHKLGWKFYLADTISKYDLDKTDKHLGKVRGLAKLPNTDITEESGMTYVADLIDRYLKQNLEKLPTQEDGGAQ
jgi:hypothetical protein